MTVGKLKRELEALDDNMQVIINNPFFGGDEISISEIRVVKEEDIYTDNYYEEDEEQELFCVIDTY